MKICIFLLFVGAALERHPFIRVKPERGKNIGESQNKSRVKAQICPEGGVVGLCQDSLDREYFQHRLLGSQKLCVLSNPTWLGKWDRLKWRPPFLDKTAQDFEPCDLINT